MASAATTSSIEQQTRWAHREDQLFSETISTHILFMGSSVDEHPISPPCLDRSTSLGQTMHSQHCGLRISNLMWEVVGETSASENGHHMSDTHRSQLVLQMRALCSNNNSTRFDFELCRTPGSNPVSSRWFRLSQFRSQSNHGRRLTETVSSRSGVIDPDEEQSLTANDSDSLNDKLISHEINFDSHFGKS